MDRFLGRGFWKVWRGNEKKSWSMNGEALIKKGLRDVRAFCFLIYTEGWRMRHYCILSEGLLGRGAKSKNEVLFFIFTFPSRLFINFPLPPPETLLKPYTFSLFTHYFFLISHHICI